MCLRLVHNNNTSQSDLLSKCLVNMQHASYSRLLRIYAVYVCTVHACDSSIFASATGWVYIIFVHPTTQLA